MKPWFKCSIEEEQSIKEENIRTVLKCEKYFGIIKWGEKHGRYVELLSLSSEKVEELCIEYLNRIVFTPVAS